MAIYNVGYVSFTEYQFIQNIQLSVIQYNQHAVSYIVPVYPPLIHSFVQVICHVHGWQKINLTYQIYVIQWAYFSIKIFHTIIQDELIFI